MEARQPGVCFRPAEAGDQLPLPDLWSKEPRGINRMIVVNRLALQQEPVCCTSLPVVSQEALAARPFVSEFAGRDVLPFFQKLDTIFFGDLIGIVGYKRTPK